MSGGAAGTTELDQSIRDNPLPHDYSPQCFSAVTLGTSKARPGRHILLCMER